MTVVKICRWTTLAGTAHAALLFHELVVLLDSDADFSTPAR